MTDRYTVSLVIPIYNASVFLSRCLDSVWNQTYDSWECILVDDGSTDGSSEICDRYALAEKRFRVIHKDNGGVSSARNTGIAAAKGDYIAFIDADDWVEPTYLSAMVHSMADMPFCDFVPNESGSAKPLLKKWGKVEIANDIDFILDGAYFGTPWLRLFKRKIIEDNHLLFDSKIRLNEDTIFVLQYITHCSTLEYIEAANYHYTGAWRGDSKYVLSFEEVMYTYRKMKATIYSLCNAFGVQTGRSIRPDFFRIENLMTRYTDQICYDYFCAYEKMEVNMFFSSMFDWDLIITQAITYSNGQLSKCFKHFFTIALPNVVVHRKINKLLLFLFAHKLYRLLDFVTKIFF